MADVAPPEGMEVIEVVDVQGAIHYVNQAPGDRIRLHQVCP
ncbi:hypothetical protein [Janibacter corallicola]|nr:hypothetical protein [Janibacter corallicola]